MPPPNSRLSGFFNGKTGFVGTVLCTRSVRWTSNMRKRTPPGELTSLPDSLVGWGGAPRFSRLWRSASVAANVKSWLHPCLREHVLMSMHAVAVKKCPVVSDNAVQCQVGHEPRTTLANLATAFCRSVCLSLFGGSSCSRWCLYKAEVL